MKKLVTKTIKFIIVAIILLGINKITAQNIFSLEPVKVLGAMNSYDTSSNSNTFYRRLSITTGNPTDGRGQWVKTYNVQNSGGDFIPINMVGGSPNGFLFISGPPSNRYTNKWVFSSTSAATLNAINPITAYNSGNDIGLNMNTAGRYTFVFNDAGYTNTNAKFYVGYTAATPITISNVSQTINTNRTATINITTSASPSSGENVFVRYTLDTAFTNASSIVQATGSGTNWTAIIPTQNNGTTIKYYVFTSTASSINSMSEIDKSLVVLNYNDNAGLNYSYTLPKGISRFTTSTPIICGTLTNYTVSIIGTDTFSSSYQWQFINSNDSTLTPTNDVTNQILGNRTQPVQFRLWRRISRVGTSNPDTSNWVLVRMNPLPTASISGTTTVCRNSSNPNITFTGASGTTPYTFTYNINGGSNTTVTTSSGSSVTVSAPTATAGIFTYNLVSVQYGSSTTCSQSQSGSATITVNPLPTASISGTTTVCQNSSTPNITFTGASGTTPYTFTYNINGGLNTTVTTPFGSSVTVSAPTTTAGTFTYNLVSVQDASSTTCSQSQSGSATITVNPLPVMTGSSSQTICSGTASNITLIANTTGGTNTFTFTTSSVSGLSGNTSSTGTPTAIAQNLSITNTSPTNAVYAVTPRFTNNGVGCNGTTTNYTVTVNPIPVNTGSNAQTICSGNASNIILTANTTGGINTFTYTTSSVLGLSGNTSSTGNPTSIAQTLSITNSSTTNAVYNVTPRFTNNGFGCNGTATNYTVTVNPRPNYLSFTDTTICSGTNLNFNMSSNTTGTNFYTWRTSTVQNVWGNNPLVDSAFNLNRILNNTDSTTRIVTYKVLSKNTQTGQPSCYAADSAIINIHVNPIPIIRINSRPVQPICSGTNLVINFSNSSYGLNGLNSWDWGASYLGGASLSGFSNAINQNSGIVNQTITNLGSNTGNIRYTITPKYTFRNVTCNGNQSLQDFTVNPKPILSLTNNDSILCNGNKTDSLLFSVNTTGAVNRFVWTLTNNTGITLLDSNSTTNTIDLLNSNATNYNYIRRFGTDINNTNQKSIALQVLPKYVNGSVCDGISKSVTIYVNPIPIVKTIFNQLNFVDTTICSSTNINIGLSTDRNLGSSTNNSFLWQSIISNGTGILGNTVRDSSNSNFRINNLINNSKTNAELTYSITPYFTQNLKTCVGSTRNFRITINPLPNVYFDDSINFGSSKQVICSGTNFKTTQFKSDYDISKTRFDWNKTNSTVIQGLINNGSGNIFSATSYNVLNKPDSALYSITPKFTYNSVTCSGSPIQTKIIVNPIPITANPFTQNTYCSDVFLAVNPWTISSANSPIGRTDYRWNFTTLPINTITGVTVTDSNTAIPNNEKISSFIATNDKTVKVTYSIKSAFTYDNKRCFENDTTFTITVNPRPAIPVFTLQKDINPDSVCYNSKFVNYSVNKFTVINDVNNYDYTWSVTPNNLPITQARNANFSLINFQTTTKPTTVEVVNNVTNNFGCISSKSKSVFVRDNEPPREDVQVVRRTTPNGKEQLWCLANDANGFQWGLTNKTTFKDSILEDEVVNIYNLDVNLLTNFNIWVKLNTSSVCAFKYYFTTPTGLKQLDKNDHFKISIYPNPAFNFINIKSSRNAIASIEIFNCIGELILIKQLDEKVKPLVLENVNIDNLAKGVYLIKVVDIDGNIAYSKFIKE